MKNLQIENNTDYKELTRRYVLRMKMYDSFERTLFAKWDQLQASRRDLATFYMTAPQIFNPQTVEEIEQVKVQIIPVTPDNSQVFRALYKFTSSALYGAVPRAMAYLIKDG